jgi:hypothetical protein
MKMPFGHYSAGRGGLTIAVLHLPLHLHDTRKGSLSEMALKMARQAGYTLKGERDVCLLPDREVEGGGGGGGGGGKTSSPVLIPTT